MADVWQTFLNAVGWRTCCLSASTKDENQELKTISQCKDPFYDESVPHDVDKSLFSASLAREEDETTQRERPEVEVELGTYKGQWLEQKRHGYGWMAFNGAACHLNGATYQGLFHSGRMHGWGALTHEANGAYYEGEWQHDLQHGFGRCSLRYGIYEGEWRFSKRSGRGIERLTMEIYDGQFGNDARDGEGICKKSDGRIFSGQWKDGLMHGVGTCRFPDGSKYEGEFYRDVQHGDGTLTSETCSYQGQWRYGERDGVSLMIDHTHVPTQEEWRGGRLMRWRQLRVPSHEDELAPGQKTVQCTVVKTPDRKLGMSVSRYGNPTKLTIMKLMPGLVLDWNDAHPDQRIELGDAIIKVNGSNGVSLLDIMISTPILDMTILKRYESSDFEKVGFGGNMVNNMLTYEDGDGFSSYEGQTLNDKRNGQGTLRTATTQYKGQWKDDMMHGHGCQTWSDGRSFVGQFFMDKFTGGGKMEWNTLKGRMVYEGEYEDDLKQGFGKFIWPDGRQYDGQWFIGKRHGRGIRTDMHGNQRKGRWIRDKFESWAGEEDEDSLSLDLDDYFAHYSPKIRQRVNCSRDTKRVTFNSAF